MALEPTEDTLYRCHFIEIFTRKPTVSPQVLRSRDDMQVEEHFEYGS